MDGLLRCSRYAFGPNRLHYCGPDANREIFAYIQESHEDMGLKHILEEFKTMYPYLDMIARANRIKDAFDNRVVEAYWIGNSLLETADRKNLFRHLHEDQRVKKRLEKKSFDVVIDKVYKGAAPHHSFHVLNIWKRTGHLDQEHNLETLDSCLVKSGKIVSLEGPFVTLKTEVLAYSEGKLGLSEPQQLKISRPFEADIDIESLQVGDLVTYHWGVICEPISEQQAKILTKYTAQHLAMANQTI